MAEVDGNRTRRAGIACSNRFEGGGAHQVHGHLRARGYPARTLRTARATLRRMKRLIVLLALVGLVAVAVKKLQSS